MLRAEVVASKWWGGEVGWAGGRGPTISCIPLSCILNMYCKKEVYKVGGGQRGENIFLGDMVGWRSDGRGGRRGGGEEGGESGGLGRPEAGAQCPCESKDGWVRSCPIFPPPPHQHIPSIPHDQDRPEARGETQQCVSSGLKIALKEKQSPKLSAQVGTHRSRVPWAVRIQREEEQEEWGKKVKQIISRCQDNYLQPPG